MTQTEIEEYITQFPIYQYAFVKPAGRTRRLRSGSTPFCRWAEPIRWVKMECTILT